MIESLSLIDAVMPDVVETRKQAVSKTAQIKTEATSANGEETASMGKLHHFPKFFETKNVCWNQTRIQTKHSFLGKD